MKIQKVRCDHCKVEWLDSMSEEQYNRATISVKEMHMLLPVKVINSRHKDGVSDSHAVFLKDVDFCSPACLLSYLFEQLKIKKVKRR